MTWHDIIPAHVELDLDDPGDLGLALRRLHTYLTTISDPGQWDEARTRMIDALAVTDAWLTSSVTDEDREAVASALREIPC